MNNNTKNGKNKKKKSLRRSGSTFGIEKLNLRLSDLSQTIPYRLLSDMYLSCCAATCDLNRGIGRLLAAHLPEVLHELPQAVSKCTMTNIQIQNQDDNYNNTPVEQSRSTIETELPCVPEARAPTGRIEVNNDEELNINNDKECEPK